MTNRLKMVIWTKFFKCDFHSMSLFCAKSRKWLTAVLTLTAAAHVWAFEPDIAAIEDMTVMERFPENSIATREKADEAVSQARAAKKRMNELVDYSTRRCQENFFVNRCIDNVRKAKLRQERRLLAVETEARGFIRQDETRKEQLRQRERDAKSAATPRKLKPAQPRVQNDAARQAQKNKEMRAQRQKETAERQAEAARRAAQADAKRAAYEKKVKEREARRLERELKLKERQEKKAQKQAQKK